MEMLSDASSTLAISTNLIAGRTSEQFDMRSVSSTTIKNRLYRRFFYALRYCSFSKKLVLSVPPPVFYYVCLYRSCFIENIAYPLAKECKFA